MVCGKWTATHRRDTWAECIINQETGEKKRKQRKEGRGGWERGERGGRKHSLTSCLKPCQHLHGNNITHPNGNLFDFPSVLTQSKAIFKVFRGAVVTAFFVRYWVRIRPRIATASAGLHFGSLVSSSSHAFRNSWRIAERRGELGSYSGEADRAAESARLAVSCFFFCCCLVGLFWRRHAVMWLICAASSAPGELTPTHPPPLLLA